MGEKSGIFRIFLTVVGLVVKQCVPCLVTPTLMLIGCNQETIVQGEGSVSLTASTSNRPDSIAALNKASEGSSDGGDNNIVLDGFPDGRDPKRTSDVASSLSLVPLVSPV